MSKSMRYRVSTTVRRISVCVWVRTRSFIKPFIAVRIIKSRRQLCNHKPIFAEIQLLQFFLLWRFNFCDNQIPDRLLSTDWVRTNADVKSWWGAYGFGTDFQIQCILYGKSQNPDCAVRTAVKRVLSLKHTVSEKLEARKISVHTKVTSQWVWLY